MVVIASWDGWCVVVVRQSANRNIYGNHKRLLAVSCNSVCLRHFCIRSSNVQCSRCRQHPLAFLSGLCQVGACWDGTGDLAAVAGPYPHLRWRQGWSMLAYLLADQTPTGQVE